MEILLIAVIAIITIAITTALGQKLGVAGPLLLVGVGLAIALMPFFPGIVVDPEWILVGVLPPLLYSSAVSLPAIEFRRDFRPIAGLSVLLVVISAVILGLFFAWAIPGLGLAMGIALGAIVSPTDAVATSIVKKLGISPRVVTMLEGESLLNDATSLVLLRTALAAVAGGFSFGFAIGSFVWAVLSALIVGALVGFINLRVRGWLAHSAANTALSFMVPFAAYLPTEALGGSGLVAAVVAGIITGQGAAKWFTPDQRLSDALNWRTVELVLEGGVFLLIGLDLKEVVRSNLEENDGLWHGTWLALSALGIVLAVRAGYVAILIWQQGRRAKRWQDRHSRLTEFGAHLDRVASGETPPRRSTDDPIRQERRLTFLRRRVTSAAADLDYYRATPLGWKHGSVIVWAGMRGVVTLAAAQTLPSDADHRALLIFVAFLVAVGSLLLQGLSLPAVVRMLKMEGSGAIAVSREEQVRLDDELRRAAVVALNSPTLLRTNGSEYSPGVIERAGSRITEPPDDEATAIARELLELRVQLIEAMRTRLNAVSTDGTFSTAALRHALAELDADQLSLELRIYDENE
ncbi:CPA1 family monovalent cation:H+ antiporter [Microbacterium halimionae]|uniref:CPA1 family monovalent cation:H+ antiporter n=1 Tax=Microbacterium halimionae TaxID=1526413 RepID=A0A7W3PKD2_9MICO|nr:sodium:proton antiporter [Microbacterium halimionae]MBA8815008.1 CPA1 family monovalent cation:H+ antiporter [Microbacterium halimionae]NII94201.1 CPA1 family monovalent cation:H+ antiporter [Microbacterium halimionae]